MDEISAILRRHDPDRYLASLLAPDAKRPHLLALYAFRAELARIASQVSEPRLAEIRLQYWLDALDSLYDGEPQAHPVAQALALAVREGNLPKPALQSLAKAYQFTFYSDPLPTVHDLEGWLGETEAAVIKMAAMILDQAGAQQASAMAGLSGVAYGLMRLLNTLPQAIALKQNFIPAELALAYGLDPLAVPPDSDPKPGAAVLAALMDLAEKRLAQAFDESRSLAPEVLPAFLHVGLTPAYLARAKALGPQVWQRGCDISQLRKQWLLWRMMRRQRLPA